MPTPRAPRDECVDVIQRIDHWISKGYRFGTQPSPTMKVAEELGRSNKWVQHRIRVGRVRYGLGDHLPVTYGVKDTAPTAQRQIALGENLGATPEEARPALPNFPEGDLSAPEIIEQLKRRMTLRMAAKEARRWFRIEMPDDLPFAIMWWGDPHLDSNGCNWPLLETHAKIAATEPAVYSVNVGDTLDNWPNGSRLIRLYAHSDQSVETAHTLARWFLSEAGIRWLVILLGNHDMWPGHTSAEWMREIAGQRVVMERWGAQFVLACPSGREFRIWAAHNFPGHSMWNPLHGPSRAQKMQDDAQVYVCGHLHNWAIQRTEAAMRGYSFSLIRTRGYKYLDEHAEMLGHAPQEHGASVLTVFDPETGRHVDFEHVEDGVRYLRALRAERIAEAKPGKRKRA